ncbi:hypothetical protein J4430_01325 [Candidatus Woesearchaeota archaeon]|nr:hypothetical protein [Candidatus Woesearchaeota archaeon]
MPIVGFQFDKVSAEKKSKVKSKLEVKNSINIKGIEFESVALTRSKDSLLRFNFSFHTEFSQGLGDVVLEGHLLYYDEEKKLKDLKRSWDNKEAMDPKLMARILNHILIRCNIKTLVLCEEVNLPPHLQIPTISPTKQNISKTAVHDYIG